MEISANGKHNCIQKEEHTCQKRLYLAYLVHSQLCEVCTKTSNI